jgi:ribosomal protein S18 acetylase RimI-like enzyme
MVTQRYVELAQEAIAEARRLRSRWAEAGDTSGAAIAERLERLLVAERDAAERGRLPPRAGGFRITRFVGDYEWGSEGRELVDLVFSLQHIWREETDPALVDDLQFRLATPSDAGAIADLHAESWRRHYRGAYSDAFLDGDVRADRLAVWTARLREPDPRGQTIVAEDEEGMVAFVHSIFEDDPSWGALVDNLHVAHGRKRRGVGSRLLGLAAGAALERGTGFYLWVLEQNRDARAFYEARGGKCVERAPVPPPGGVRSRLNGAPFGLRYAWTHAESRAALIDLV